MCVLPKNKIFKIRYFQFHLYDKLINFTCKHSRSNYPCNYQANDPRSLTFLHKGYSSITSHIIIVYM